MPDYSTCFDCKYSRHVTGKGFYCDYAYKGITDEQATAILAQNGLTSYMQAGIIYFDANGDSLPPSKLFPCSLIDTRGDGYFIDKAR